MPGGGEGRCPGLASNPVPVPEHVVSPGNRRPARLDAYERPVIKLNNPRKPKVPPTKITVTMSAFSRKSAALSMGRAASEPGRLATASCAAPGPGRLARMLHPSSPTR